MAFPQLSFLSRVNFRTALVYSLYGPVAAAIFRIITELRVFVVQCWRGDMAAGLDWSAPIGIMMAWRRSQVTITATGVATLNFGGCADARLRRR